MVSARLSAAATAFIVLSFAFCAAADTHPKVLPMSDDKFWSIVDATRTSQPNAQIKALHASLEKLPVEDIEAFEVAFGNQLKRSYSWDLWGADHVIHGGASDDSFEYFRRWLISRGRRDFESAVADPDSLASIIPANVREPLEFEEFAYVARDVWSNKTGRPASEMPVGAELVYVGLDPSGAPFDESEAALSARYPKLWKRFGTRPLF
jgi:hypothetical protein